jgi:predicted MPP superfamily phosphohydrolase
VTRALTAVPVAALAGAGAALYHARHAAPFDPVVERVQFCTAHPLASAGAFRIGFVADTHVGPIIRATDVARALDLLYESPPDLLLLGGDYVCESPRFIPDAVGLFRDYVQSSRLGALAVLGNHDYSCDAKRIGRELESLGVRVLSNEAIGVGLPQTNFWIAGIDDAILGAADPESAFAGLPSGGPAVALWHEPDWAEAVARLGGWLQLSGHSHGGQVRLPSIGNLAAPWGGRRFVAGINWAEGMPVYTSRGLGVFRPPLRVACAPEVTLITLAPIVENGKGCVGQRLPAPRQLREGSEVRA